MRMVGRKKSMLRNLVFEEFTTSDLCFRKCGYVEFVTWERGVAEIPR